MKRKVAFMWLDAAACLFLPLVISSPLFGQTTYTARGYVLSAPNSGFSSARPFTTPDAASAGSPMSVVGSGSGSGTGGYTHALLWPGADQIIDLNPAGFAASDAAGTSSTEQVGEAFGPSNSNIDHAMLWRGSAASFVDLDPAGSVGSDAISTDGQHQVGYYGDANAGNADHAVLWSGTAASAVDLNPGFAGNSSALGVFGNQQVGQAYGGFLNGNHAIVWNGTADSAIDLNPTGFDSSFALATNGLRQLGYGFGTNTSNHDHALLWDGTARSYTDLNPTDLTTITDSFGEGMNATQQVGYGFGPGLSGTSSFNHALTWSGTAQSAVDLQAFLGPQFVSSEAYTIDAHGNIFGVASDGQSYYAIEWSPVPEPAGLAILALCMVALARGRPLTPIARTSSVFPRLQADKSGPKSGTVRHS